MLRGWEGVLLLRFWLFLLPYSVLCFREVELGFRSVEQDRTCIPATQVRRMYGSADSENLIILNPISPTTLIFLDFLYFLDFLIERETSKCIYVAASATLRL